MDRIVEQMASPDATDRRLIRLLQDHPRASHSELSRISGISVSTVRRRVEALCESGVITFSVLPNVRQIGYHAVSLIGINVDYRRVDEIADRLRDFEEVTLVLITLGRYDLFVGVVLREVDEIHAFLKERVAPLEGVRSFESFVTASAPKLFQDWRVPHDDEDAPG